eukprot:TRINITY_DN47766_c0_g1_i1.p1 TRINITY_DN47766_c0_g1~~TRINITY_DN47766_c0_g1_i1.p1  ORF type:complete len:605 (+),score=272.32 TRINITY_DN47766_c0_g1_i1:92-1816(+)
MAYRPPYRPGGYGGGGYGGAVNRIGGPGTITMRPTAAQLPAEQSYSQKVRCVIEHRLRTPHRRHIQDRLQSVIAHWTEIPVGEAPFLKQLYQLQIKTSEDDVVIAPDEDEPYTGVDVVNARCLIIAGVDHSGASRHILRRVELIGGAYLGEESRNICAYGGVVLKGSEAQILQQMIRMVRDQCGVDFSDMPTWYKFLELDYGDAGPTVFYVPAIWEYSEERRAQIKFVPQVQEERERLTEEYEDEEVDEDATVQAMVQAMQRKEEAKQERFAQRARDRAAKVARGETPSPDKEEEDDDDVEVPKVMRKVVKTREIEKVSRTKTITPLRFSLANFADFQVRTATDADTVEFCCAADAVDEFLKREMVTRIYGCIKQKQEQAASNARQEAERTAVAGERKRKRGEEEEVRKKARKGEIDALTKAWAKEDEGLTDEDKRRALKKRQEVLKAKREQFAQEDKERQRKEESEDAADGAGAVRMETVCEQGLLDAFSFFDRLPGFTRVTGTLPRLKVENMLMALDSELTADCCQELLSIPQIPKIGGSLPYKQLAIVTRPVQGSADGKPVLAPAPADIID